MPKPYSYDLLQKVMQAIEMDGLRKNEASQLFDISRISLVVLDETGKSMFTQLFAMTVSALPEKRHSN
jgi:hypothetical protein